MRIVKPTNPPSMAIIVDTITQGDVQFHIAPAHPVYSRTDIVWCKPGFVGVLHGIDKVGAPSRSLDDVIVPTGGRLLAKIYVYPSCPAIYKGNIEEIES